VRRGIGRASSLNVDPAWKPGAELAGAGADEAPEAVHFRRSPSRNLPPLPLNGGSPLARAAPRGTSTSASIGREGASPLAGSSGSGPAGGAYRSSAAGGKGSTARR